MGGSVYLRTNRFSVKLEGIKFKTKDFQHLCNLDFLFPTGKLWDCPPLVGLDVMPHPRDPSLLLLLLCFGVGCVILRFPVGIPLPYFILNFLSDKRIHFVGFGIPEKGHLFPFRQLGLTRHKTDVGYLAAEVLRQPKCKNSELSELARKVLGIKRMVALTDGSSSRHEQIKCAICQVFITSVVAMTLVRVDDAKKSHSQKKLSFLKNLSYPYWLKGRKKNETVRIEKEADSVRVHVGQVEDLLSDDDFFDEYPSTDEEGVSSRTPLKGILKSPSTCVRNCGLSQGEEASPLTLTSALKRANSKGCNVRFMCE